MRYLLDTCVLSEFLRKRSEERVLGWVKAQDEDLLFLSVLTIGEIQKGIAKLPDSRRKSELQLWLENVVERYGGRVLPVSRDTAIIWGDLKARTEKIGRPIPAIDSLIAATALEHKLTLVTRNEDDFKPTGVSMLNPWK